MRASAAEFPVRTVFHYLSINRPIDVHAGELNFSAGGAIPNHSPRRVPWAVTLVTTHSLSAICCSIFIFRHSVYVPSVHGFFNEAATASCCFPRTG